MNEWVKSDSICQSYAEMKGSIFSWLTVYIVNPWPWFAYSLYNFYGQGGYESFGVPWQDAQVWNKQRMKIKEAAGT